MLTRVNLRIHCSQACKLAWVVWYVFSPQKLFISSFWNSRKETECLSASTLSLLLLRALLGNYMDVILTFLLELKGCHCEFVIQHISGFIRLDNIDKRSNRKFLLWVLALVESMLRASLVAQWLRICLPMQGTRVRALVWEDPTWRGATKPVSHNYWACASGACAPQWERPWQWEVRAPRWRVAPTRRNWRKPSQRNEDPTQPKINK